MTAVVTAPSAQSTEPDKRRVTQSRVIKSEFLKASTLRSTYIVLALAIAAMAGIGIIICWTTAMEWSHMRDRHRLHFNPLNDSLGGFELAQLAIGVLGILLVGGEYSTGMIRASLSAVPKRLPMLWGKLVVFVTITLVTMIPSVLIAFFVSQKTLENTPIPIHVSWSTPTVPRIVIGTALYLTVIAAFSIGLATILRSIAGAIATLVGVIIVLPAIASALPQTWGDRINKFLPSNAGQAIMSIQSDTQQMTPWRGLGLFALYAVGVIAIGAVMLRRRDA